MLLHKINCATAVLLAVATLGTLGGALLQPLLNVKSRARETRSQNTESKGEPSKLTAVMVQAFEKASAPPTVWVVNRQGQDAVR